MKNKSIILITSFLIIFSKYSFAHDSFEKWLNEFKAEAISRGISEKTLEVLNNAKPSEKTIKLDRNQPEFKLTFQMYKRKVVSDYRLNKAKIEYKKNIDVKVNNLDKSNSDLRADVEILEQRQNKILKHHFPFF